MKQILALSLILWATCLLGCAGSGGSSASSAAAANQQAIGNVPASNATQPAVHKYMLGNPICEDTTGKITAAGIVKQQNYYGGMWQFTTETFELKTGGAFSRVITGSNCTATITGLISFNVTTKQATLSTMTAVTSNNGSCTLPLSLEAVIGSGAFNTTDMTYVITHHQTLSNQTIDYMRLPQDQSNLTQDPGFGLSDTSHSVVGDAASKCFLYYL